MLMLMGIVLAFLQISGFLMRWHGNFYHEGRKGYHEGHKGLMDYATDTVFQVAYVEIYQQSKFAA